jgi:OPT family oligopeptide transporter
MRHNDRSNEASMATTTRQVTTTSGLPDEPDRDWYERVYQGDRMPQLTVRAAVMGMLLGMVLSLSNIYVGLKAGWSLGVAITACILAFSIFSALHRLAPRLFPPFSILENNAMQSCASAAGYMAGSGLVSAIPALMMMNPAALPANHWYIALWIVVVSMLGVFLAVPAKRQMINIERLPFPSGIAAATTLRTLHAEGDTAKRQARALGLAGLAGSLITWFRDASWAGMPYPNIPATWGTSWLRVGGYSFPQLTMSFEGSLLLAAAGAIVGFRQAWSLFLGAAVNYLVLAPWMLHRGIIAAPTYRAITGWSLWIGVPMMVTSSLLLFASQWRMVVRAVTAMAGSRSQGRADATSATSSLMARVEVPGSWLAAGFVVFGGLAVWLGHVLFAIVWWMGLIAVLATFLLVLVAARVTGETDITPIGPLSKITQLTFGAIQPGNATTNLMTAAITAGATAHAGDLLTDLKSGYLLGANPRQQFIAQFLGVVAGGLVVVPAFYALVPDASYLGTPQWPAPAAIVWRSVAELLSKGLGALDPTARAGLVIGGLIGIVLPLLEMTFPKRRAWIPSATALGLAFTIPGFNSVSFLIGGLAALWFTHVRPRLANEYIVPVSSGIIAGESLIGVLIAMLTIRGWLG